jgi:hypothetical protein
MENKDKFSGYTDHRDEVDFKISSSVASDKTPKNRLSKAVNISHFFRLFLFVLFCLVIIIQIQKIASLENKLQKIETLLCNTIQIKGDNQKLLRCNQSPQSRGN